MFPNLSQDSRAASPSFSGWSKGASVSPPAESSPERLTLHAVRLIGMADDADVAARFGLDLTLARELLLDFQAFGWITRVEFDMTVSGAWSRYRRARPPKSPRLGRWQQVLATPLTRTLRLVSVRRSLITSAERPSGQRRAAHGLAAHGRARVLHVPDTDGDGDTVTAAIWCWSSCHPCRCARRALPAPAPPRSTDPTRPGTQ
jgi:hypothetical protein